MISTGRGKVAELKQLREAREKTVRVRRGWKGARLFLVISLIIAGTITASLVNQLSRLQMMENNVETIKAQVEDLKHKNAGLREEIKKLKTDSYIEQVAREQLGLVKPGETLVVQAQHSTEGTGRPAPQPKIRDKNIYD